MSEQNRTTPRAITAIKADLDSAIAEAKALNEAIEAAGDEATDEQVAELAQLEAQREAVKAEFDEAKAALLAAEYEAIRAKYDAATTAGVKAALRRDMNRIRKLQGLPELVAGSKSAGPRFSADVLALLEMEEGEDS